MPPQTYPCLAGRSIPMTRPVSGEFSLVPPAIFLPNGGIFFLAWRHKQITLVFSVGNAEFSALSELVRSERQELPCVPSARSPGRRKP